MVERFSWNERSEKRKEAFFFLCVNLSLRMKGDSR